MLVGDFDYAIEYQVPPFALSAAGFGSATEYLLPPFALIGLVAPPISTTWLQQCEKWHAAVLT